MRPRRRRPPPPPPVVPVGALPARDALLPNPYADVRYTRCPRCGHRTRRRKVPLLLAVAGYGPVVLGKTGPYCANCRLVIAHRDELEGELTTLFARLAPAAVGPAYAVLGTVDLRAWRRGLSAAPTLDEVLRHTAPFTTTLSVEYSAVR